MVMEKQAFKSKMTDVFSRSGLRTLTDGEIEKFYTLTEILLEENEKYNLTAIKEPGRIILNHYADCAALTLTLPEGVSVADVGCGAGFPSLPIAILRPDVKILGIDSTQKRINYVNMAKDKLELNNIRAICARAEDAGSGELRETFDIVTARAVAALPILCELCLPLVKVGGRMIAMKGKNAENELSDSAKAITALGGKLSATKDVRLTDGEEEVIHPLIIIDKKSKTPPQYPRAYAKILKKPL